MIGWRNKAHLTKAPSTSTGHSSASVRNGELFEFRGRYIYIVITHETVGFLVETRNDPQSLDGMTSDTETGCRAAQCGGTPRTEMVPRDRRKKTMNRKNWVHAPSGMGGGRGGVDACLA